VTHLHDPGERVKNAQLSARSRTALRACYHTVSIALPRCVRARDTAAVLPGRVARRSPAAARLGGQDGLLPLTTQQQHRRTGAGDAGRVSPRPMGQPGEQRVELGGVVLQRAGDGRAGQASGHRDHLSCDVAPQPMPSRKPARLNKLPLQRITRSGDRHGPCRCSPLGCTALRCHPEARASVKQCHSAAACTGAAALRNHGCGCLVAAMASSLAMAATASRVVRSAGTS
jgi:hypothetical protein